MGWFKIYLSPSDLAALEQKDPKLAQAVKQMNAEADRFQLGHDERVEAERAEVDYPKGGFQA